MPRSRTSMRKIREVLRLSVRLGLSQRQVGRSVKLKQSTVWDYLMRWRASGLSWDDVASLDDDELERRLFPTRSKPSRGRRPPDFVEMHQELKRKGVTLSLLWEEYRQREPEGYGYSRYCDLYREWRKQLEVSLRQDYRGGEKLFVDYAGETVAVKDRSTGEIQEAQIFVAALGASNFIFAEATLSQRLRDWVGSHERTFAFIGGVTELVIPDNLKSGVSRPEWYEPDVNPTYAEMAEHYGVAVLPARVGHPQDKAKVENAVLQVERWILARLRKQSFFSFGELNRAIAELLVELNDRPLKVLGVSRRDLFERVERPALGALPSKPYDFGRWKKARVAPDYHVELDGHYYSVPYQLIREQLDLRWTATTVEIFRRGKRQAAHARSQVKGGHTTVREHMPKTHQAYLEWTPPKLLEWAHKIGPETAKLVEEILRTKPHPQQGYRACLGLLRLSKEYGEDRLEAATTRARALRSTRYQSVKSILKAGLDQEPLERVDDQHTTVPHDNVRGADYYGGEEVAPC